MKSFSKGQELNDNILNGQKPAFHFVTFSSQAKINIELLVSFHFSQFANFARINKKQVFNTMLVQRLISCVIILLTTRLVNARKFL